MKVPVIFLFFCSFGVLSAQGISYETLEARSELWPERVAVVDPQGTPMEGLKGRRLTGFTVFVENGEVLIDFGSNGLHRIALKQTDILERAKEIAQNPDLLKRSNFVSNLYMRTFLPARVLGESQKGIFEGAVPTHFLLVYVDMESRAFKGVVETVRNHKEAISSIDGKYRVKIVVSPVRIEDQKLIDLAVEHGMKHWSFVPSFQAESYARLLGHGVEPRPKVVLIDFDQAKLAETTNAVSASGLDTFLTNLPETIRAHEKARATAAQQ
ncbi:MAG: hypothetical protein ACFBZ8_02250 [Opitutales bacterium]